MNTRIIKIGCLLFAGISTLFLCTTSDPVQMVGNSSQTPNALVGMLYEPDGKTPAQGVKVQIRSRNTLALSSGIDSTSGSNDTASTLTNSSGWFSFDTSLTAGVYVIEALSGGNALFIDSIQIAKGALTDTLPAGTLKPAGAIRGRVELVGGGDPSYVYVLAFGIDRFSDVNHDGGFVLPSLAEGKYDLRLITGLLDYTPLDTLNIEVFSAETTDIGTLELQYTGFPIPSGVKSSYDSATQMVTVTWNRMDTALVKSYLLSIRVQWGETAFSNNINWYDTIYSEKIDLTKGTQWECQVAGIDSNGNEGPLTDTIRYTLLTTDTLTEIGQSILLEQVSDSLRITKDIDDNIWLADYGSRKVFEYSRNGILRTSWAADISKSEQFKGAEFHSYIMNIDIYKNVYLENASGNSVVKYDSTGRLLGSLSYTGDTMISGLSSDQNGNLYTVISSMPWRGIFKYNQNLDKIDSIRISKIPSSKRDLIVHDSVFYFTGDCIANPDDVHDLVRVYTTKSFESNCVYGSVNCLAFTIDNSGLVYGIDGPNDMWISDTASLHQKCYVFNPGISVEFNDVKGIEILRDGTIAICLYNYIIDCHNRNSIVLPMQ
jgi:hypothetical protein